jgi:hypothetical protein
MLVELAAGNQSLPTQIESHDFNGLLSTKIGQKSSGSRLCGVTKRGSNLGGIQRIGLHVRLDRKSYKRTKKPLFCPSFESWWVRREERDLSEWEMQQIMDIDRYEPTAQSPCF